MDIKKQLLQYGGFKIDIMNMKGVEVSATEFPQMLMLIAHEGKSYIKSADDIAYTLEIMIHDNVLSIDDIEFHVDFTVKLED